MQQQDKITPTWIQNEIIRRAAATKDFYSFVQLFAPILTKDQWQERPYQKVLCQLLDQAVNGQILKLIFHLPPGAGKSLIISQLFPAYYLGKFPQNNFLSASHTYDFAVSLAQKAHLIWENPVYQELFPESRIDPEGVDREDRWQIKGRIGDYKTTGIGGRIAGVRANILLLDDFIGGPQDLTETKFEQIESWFFEVARDRLRMNAPQIIVCTPWHINDLSQKLAREEKDWLVVRFPIICDDPSAQFEYRQQGEVLFNNEQFVRSKQQETPIARAWAAKWMCSPIPDSGNIFQKEWIMDYENSTLPPKHECVKFIICDPALGQKDSDYSTIGIFQYHLQSNVIYLVDLIHQKLTYPETLDLLEKLSADPWLAKIFIEGGGTQKGLTQFSWIKKLRVHEIIPKGSKELRAEQTTPKFAQGEVLLPKRHSLRSIIEKELLSFPNGEHDDIVDTIVYAVKVTEEGLVGHWRDYQETEEITKRDIYGEIMQPTNREKMRELLGY